MTCDDVRLHLLDLERGLLSPEVDREIRAHMASCAGCTRARAEEEVLTELLERRLPVHAASPALKRRLAALAPAPRLAGVAPPSRGRRWTWAIAPALAAAAILLAVGVTMTGRSARDGGVVAALTNESVNDHLRVLQRDRPVELESGEMHEVKPWFQGKLDFAPSVPPPVQADMRLEGGSVGYFVDRKAAVVVYGVRRHVVTLLVFRAEGLVPPTKGGADARSPSRADARGFHVFTWRSGDLGYALVGDIDPAELGGIAAKLALQT